MFALPSLAGCLATTAAGCACSCCSLATREILKSSARVAYSVLFTFSMLLAWILRDFAKPLISKIPWIIKPFSSGDMPPDAWFGQQAVFRLSLGNFLLFGILAAVMSFPGPVKYKSDWRDKGLHHGGWPIKVALWIAFNLIPFFFSNSTIAFYASVARICSPLFLGIQMIIIIEMTSSWNDSWVAEGEGDDRYLYALLFATIGAYGLCATLIGLSYHWFAPSEHDCSLNISLITLSLLLILVVSLATFHPVVGQHNSGASIFVASCTSLYVCYLSFSAMQSEPRDYECNALGHRLSAASGTTLAAGMVLTLLSTVWAAFRAGSNTQTFAMEWQAEDGSRELLLGGRSVQNDEAELTSAGLDGVAPTNPSGMERGSQVPQSGAAMADFEPVTYNYAQFYVIFALASMYIAMLMTGWGSGKVQKDLIDVGWPSVWVKTVSSWVAALLYLWTLFAPAVLSDRTFS